MVSIIVPVYNGAKFIKEAIDSAISQGIDNMEIIVVDDGSTDSTREVVNSIAHPSIKYIYQQNKGPASARNTGLKEARYEFITFLDSDDLWPEDKLKRQIDLLSASPQLKVVGGLINYFYMPGSEYRKKDLSIDQPVFNVQLGGLMIRKEVIEIVGGFNESLIYGEDQDWLMRIREKNLRIQIVDEVVLHYRIHEGNMTIQKNTKDLNTLKALKLSLDRRRKEGINSLGPIGD